MEIQARIVAFESLGKVFRSVGKEGKLEILNTIETGAVEKLNSVLPSLEASNPWFKNDNVVFAINSLGESLRLESLKKWLDRYDTGLMNNNQVIGVVMAGNLPLVGFHDFLSVLISGNKLLAKLSSQDNKLLPLVYDILCEIESGFDGNVRFTEGKMEGFDAILATGSGNTARYFEYYFGKYPNIIRKNRNGVAVLTGQESQDDLLALADDVFLHFGLGCRNVSKLFVPQGYDFNKLFEAFEKFAYLKDHYKYFNNYEYYKSILLINNVKHFDNGFVILKEDEVIASSISVVHYEYYNDLTVVNNKLAMNSSKIQCVVSSSEKIVNHLEFGKAQSPELWDYADGVDTMDFLLNLRPK